MADSVPVTRMDPRVERAFLWVGLALVLTAVALWILSRIHIESVPTDAEGWVVASPLNDTIVLCAIVFWQCGIATTSFGWSRRYEAGSLLWTTGLTLSMCPLIFFTAMTLGRDDSVLWLLASPLILLALAVAVLGIAGLIRLVVTRNRPGIP